MRTHACKSGSAISAHAQSSLTSACATLSVQVFNLWRRLDVIAIFFGSVCFATALCLVVFPWWATVLMSGVSSTIAIMASMHFWNVPDGHELDNGKHAAFIGSIILCYWIPMLYALVRDALNGRFTWSSGMVVGEVASLFVGGLLFAQSWPQKFAPGAFDVFGHSHQMLHVAAMIAHVCKFFFIYFNST